MGRATKQIRTFCEDDQGNLTLFQRPNAPLVGWAIFMVLSRVAHSPALQQSFSILSLASLGIWAVLEIVRGDSNFRKVLGGIFLLGIIFSLVQ